MCRVGCTQSVGFQKGRTPTRGLGQEPVVILKSSPSFRLTQQKPNTDTSQGRRPVQELGTCIPC